MRYKLFGNSGLRVSELCLGAMTFGEEWSWGASKEESQRLFDAFVQAGGNFIDTANNWVRQQKRGVIIPILGARKLSQLQDNLASLNFTLTDEQLQRLDAASAIELGFPHDFLARESVQQVIYGNTLPLIDNHHIRS
jgi:aryl-alcohol dehydrogenase-like predicted oxidoreductase